MNTIYPFALDSVAKSAIWGGQKLVFDFHKQTPFENLAEAWELTVRDKENSTVKNGIYAGLTLAEILKRLGNTAIGAHFTDTHFPLLIKLIDANDDLSVQVHPDDDYAGRVEADIGKTEMWHIVAAEPGATIIYGLADGITASDFAEAVRAGNFAHCMRRIPVSAGETYFIPAGMLHAIGKGVLIAEVQQNCDLTYRVYDYDRRGADGKPRALHLEKALEVIRPFTDEEIEALRFAEGDKEAVVSCPYFTVYRVDLNGRDDRNVSHESFEHLLCLDGEGAIEYENQTYPLCKGASYFLPAGLGRYTLYGNAALLCSRI